MRHTAYYEFALIFDQLLIFYDTIYLQILLDNFMTESPQMMHVSVSELICKTGNKYFNVPLMQKT